MVVTYKLAAALCDPPSVNLTPGDSHWGAFARVKAAWRVLVRDGRGRAHRRGPGGRTHALGPRDAVRAAGYRPSKLPNRVGE